MAEKPVVLFVHGSWHNPNHFRPVRDVFESQGFRTVCPAQPSYGAEPDSSKDLTAIDVKTIKDAISELVEKGNEVIVVMHSYGGVIGTQAVDEQLGKKARAAKELKGGVTNLVYLCAFILPNGDSLASALGGGLPPYIKLEDDGRCWMMEPETRFYNDLSKSDQEKWAAELRLVPTSTQFAPISYAAYEHYPTTYLYCENDQALPLQVQQMMVGRNGSNFSTETCSSGHSPFLSQPETVLKVVEKLVA